MKKQYVHISRNFSLTLKRGKTVGFSPISPILMFPLKSMFDVNLLFAEFCGKKIVLLPPWADKYPTVPADGGLFLHPAYTA